MEADYLKYADSIDHEKIPFRGIGTYYTYYISPNDTTLYCGFSLEGVSNPDELFEYGLGGMRDVQMAPSSAFGLADVRITGVCLVDGGKCNYFIGKDKINPASANSLTTLMWDAYEEDLDGDGVTEVVIVAPNQPIRKIYIYKYTKGRMEWTEVTEALKREPVDKIMYDSKNKRFIAQSGSVATSYRYAEGKDRLIRVKQ
ncbi:hypothetical protein [Paenibacillus sp. MMS18-CY102]|uniref:hypothetical protein n=1 Tax=Paenibacillus sp. MMS18-CY102 TaxID=2682849 RepID=UPI0013662FB4|nr:hypothetical protein [Paenibacillus sp. MMS18-CY102]MWC31307.1 hypothetical protein [Paenibacillus sp. MMS18-CY102]